jgi:hypothetical protein
MKASTPVGTAPSICTKVARATLLLSATIFLLQIGEARAGGTGTAPTLLAGYISDADVAIGTPEEAPTITFAFTASGTLVSWSFVFTAPHGETLQLAGATVQAAGDLPPAGTFGTINCQNAYLFSRYAEAGTWRMTAAYLLDATGNITIYDEAQLASLFPSLILNVSNANPQDFVAPTVSAGVLLNRTVSLSGVFPYVGAQVAVSDNLSGVIGGQLYLNMPNGQPYRGLFPDAYPVVETGTYGPLPVTRGSFQFGDGFGPNAPTGIWTITGYQLCDVANNCLTDTKAANVLALFGTNTITVTP